jgi:hypothetical protein
VDVGGHRQQVVAALAPHQHAGQHAALGAVEAGELGLVGAQLLHVVGEQVVQEGAGVLAGGADRAEVFEGHHNGALGGQAHILPFVLAELDRKFVRKACALGGEMGLPACIHQSCPVAKRV